MFLQWFILSVLCGMGLGDIFVQKRKSYPVRYWNINARIILRKLLGRKPSWVLQCSTCFAFWATLIVEIPIFFISDYNYFFWPFSGFFAAFIIFRINQYFDK